jgi:hypothetical protein
MSWPVPGSFRARAQSATLGYAGTGTAQVAVRFEITDSEYAGKTATWFGSFTERSWDRTVESLRHCGWQGDDISDLTGIDQNEVELVMEEEEHNGAWRTRPRWVNALGGGVGLKEAMTQDQLRAFAAKMKGKLVAKNQREGTPRSAERAKASRTATRGRPRDDDPPPPSDEDAPF